MPDPDGLQLRAYRIDKLYAHDDQVGPFARMPFLGGGLLGTSWLAENGTSLLQVRPNLLILPLLFDATDIERGPFFVRAIEYDAALSVILRAVGQTVAEIPALHSDPDWPVWSWFAAQP